ncbi:biotin-dependent carboxyltransferase family protein [Rhizobium sp. C4]|uniref:5-oxoprolinase subunit C family protein n=1 Tax=Rhizobium sp. C4 TaxID=1349800 RepID=UPI001E29BEE8|nr:biotin-dependent carboxyltransferase family protein [Rhizobium sp. C4]MCD2174257.1 biotin-dependent carboxyltransferase family protein [Rhizobium sp. C4]
MIEVLTTGAANSIQDLGRNGRFDIGVSRSGAMDRLSLMIGNALLGNDLNAAGLEIAIFPFRLRFDQPTRFAVTGAEGDVTLGGRPLPPRWAASAAEGETLVIAPPEKGARVYITFAGGIEIEPVLGSRATDLKSGYGGLEGRGLRRGDRLTVAAMPPMRAFGAALDPFAMLDFANPLPVRAVPAAEFSVFSADARKLFSRWSWRVTPEADRMGYRLEGPELKLERRLELMSHGILPGTIQVPPSGKPIIQLADANTCGGYPKIATIIEADLWIVGQAGPESRFLFTEVTPDEANAALRRQRLEIDALARTVAVARSLAG